MTTGFLLRCAAALIAISSAAAGQPRTVVYVNPAAAPGGNGASWAGAYQHVQQALANAGAQTDIWIAAGVYRPDMGSGMRSSRFLVASGVRMYGGFAGGEALLTQRDPETNPTVLSGDLGVAGDIADNCFHVVVMQAGAEQTQLHGLVITGGNADGANSPDDSGGGVYADGVRVLLEGCVVTANSARFGGGVFVRNAPAVFAKTTFRSNSAIQDGGGAVLRGGATITDCIFDANNAVFGGAFLTCCQPSRVERCVFRGNVANKGGAVYLPVGACAIIACTFAGNSGVDGGAVNSLATGTTIINCRFTANSAQSGGAVHTVAGASIVNSVFTRNFAIFSGGGVHTGTQSSTITNCSMWSNTALTSGGGIYIAGGSPAVRNCILWDNNDSAGKGQSAQITRVSGGLTIGHCCIQGWTGSLGGVGSFSADPRFTSAAGIDGVPGTEDDDLSLRPGSPCIDAGDRGAVPADVADIDADGNTAEPLPLDFAGNPRFVDDPATPNTGVGPAPYVDIGAHEFVPGMCAGDANNDNMVNGADLSVLLAQFGLMVLPPGMGADLNADGVVNGADLSILLAQWGNSCGVAVADAGY